MTNLAFEGFGRDERIADDRSTWFTPPHIAAQMVSWVASVRPGSILEPSAGSGNLVAAARKQWPTAHIRPIEIDPFYAGKMANRFQGDPHISITDRNYLEEPAPTEAYDLGLANPPYEEGLDGEFLAKLMDECDVVVALVRLACLAGSSRNEKVWSRISHGWNFSGLAIFSTRPQFEPGRAIGTRKEGESAKTDFCVVKLSRFGSSSTQVVWW